MPIAAGPSSKRRLPPAPQLMQAIVRHPKPVIAEVDGLATAAGCQLVASCDLAIASHEATLLHAGRQHRPVLLDADGGAVAQRLAQAGDGDAADRRDDRRGDRQGFRPGQPRRAARIPESDRHQIRANHCFQIIFGGEDRQGSLLRAGRDGAGGCLCLYRPRHGREHARRATRRKASAPSSASASRNGRTNSRGTAHLHHHHRDG